MNKIKCLLVDDEPPAIELLQTYTGMIEQLEVVGTCHSAVKAFDLLNKHQVDLIFLDIQMPVLNGIDFIKSLKNPPAIILTTAYREFALDGYDLDIIDYLLKPIPFNRFLKAVDRYRERANPSNASENPTPSAPEDHIFININRVNHKIKIQDILYIESLKDYVRVHTTKERLVVKGNIGSFMKKMPEERFLRIHRSFAIALPYIDSYSQTEVHVNSTPLPIGASYKEVFSNKMKE